jgi:hypothetical protein
MLSLSQVWRLDFLKGRGDGKQLSIALAKARHLKAQGQAVHSNSGKRDGGNAQRACRYCEFGPPVEARSISAGPGADSVIASRVDASSEARTFVR